MGQHICFGAMCDIVANSRINVIRGTYTQRHWLHGQISYKTYKLCPFKTFFTLKNGLATNNDIGLLIVRLIINIFAFYLETRICYVFYALDRHHNLLVLKFQLKFTVNWWPLSHKRLIKAWILTHT